MDWVSAAVNGLLLGGLYGLFGLGLALVFGVMRVVNLAHGELIVAGAFLGVFLVGLLPGVPPWALALPVALAGAGFGWTLQTLLVNPALKVGINGGQLLVPLMLTFGLGVVLRNAGVEVFGADSRAIDGGAFTRAGVDLFGLQVGLYPLVVLALAVVLFVALQLLLSRSEFGRVVRATADAPEVARLMGVKPERVFAQVMALGTSFAMLAGFLLAQRTSFTPFSGAERMLIAFEVVIIGGLGSFWGALGGGMLLGLAQVLGQKWDSNAGSLYVHLVFLLVLLLMPRGLAGDRR
jgi:branched-chain amino acid transport system permease protein